MTVVPAGTRVLGAGLWFTTMFVSRARQLLRSITSTVRPIVSALKARLSPTGSTGVPMRSGTRTESSARDKAASPATITPMARAAETMRKRLGRRRLISSVGSRVPVSTSPLRSASSTGPFCHVAPVFSRLTIARANPQLDSGICCVGRADEIGGTLNGRPQPITTDRLARTALLVVLIVLALGPSIVDSRIPVESIPVILAALTSGFCVALSRSAIPSLRATGR